MRAASARPGHLKGLVALVGVLADTVKPYTGYCQGFSLAERGGPNLVVEHPTLVATSVSLGLLVNFFPLNASRSCV